jgi:hypothetical protein
MILVTIFKNGGFPMIFIVLFGAIGLGTAFWYALRPDAKHEGFIKWISRATLWAILNGFCSDLATVAKYLSSADPQPDPELRVRILLEGFYESMSPGILGFAFLSLIALLAAVGRRRLDARVT